MSKYKLKKDLKAGDVIDINLGSELCEEVKEYKRWRAEESEEYYYLDTDGEVLRNNDEYMTTGDERYQLGNYFKTAEEVRHHRNYLLSLQEMKDLAEGYEHHPSKDNHYIFYNYNKKYFKWDWEGTIKRYTVYFESEEKAKHAIDTLGEEKLKLIFNIK